MVVKVSDCDSNCQTTIIYSRTKNPYLLLFDWIQRTDKSKCDSLVAKIVCGVTVRRKLYQLFKEIEGIESNQSMFKLRSEPQSLRGLKSENASFSGVNKKFGSFLFFFSG